MILEEKADNAFKASMDMDPEMAKEMAETRKRMQGMQNMDFVGSYVVLIFMTTTPVYD